MKNLKTNKIFINTFMYIFMTLLTF